MKTIDEVKNVIMDNLNEMRSELMYESNAMREKGEEWECIKRKIGVGIVGAYTGAVNAFNGAAKSDTHEVTLSMKADEKDPFLKMGEMERFIYLIRRFENQLRDSWRQEMEIASSHGDFESEEKGKVKLYYSGRCMKLIGSVTGDREE